MDRAATLSWRKRDGEPSRYGPEPPFLAKLERKLYDEHQRTLRRKQQARAGAADRRRAGGFAIGRMGRRAAISTGLLVAIAATALGATAIVGGGRAGHRAVTVSNPVAVASGSAGPDQWTLNVWRRGGSLCRELLVANVEQSGCQPPPAAGAAQATSVESPTRRYVFGLAGAGVATVTVTVATAIRTVHTHATDGVAGIAAMARGRRWFVAILPRQAGVRAPAAKVTAHP